MDDSEQCLFDMVQTGLGYEDVMSFVERPLGPWGRTWGPAGEGLGGDVSRWPGMRGACARRRQAGAGRSPGRVAQGSRAVAILADGAEEPLDNAGVAQHICCATKLFP